VTKTTQSAYERFAQTRHQNRCSFKRPKHSLYLILLLLGLEFTGPAVAENDPPVRALLVPAVESTLSSRMAGRITKISVREGERFKEGERLINFDCEIQGNYLKKSQAKLLAAEKTHQSNLLLKDYNSIGDLDIELSSAEVKITKADVAVIKSKLKRCRINAPFDGRVIELMAHAHESVSEHQPLIAILDDRNLEVQLYIPSWWLSWLETGKKFSIRIDETGKTYSASVIRLGARVDAASQSIRITAAITGKNPELLAGMSGVAFFDIPDRK
jgi:membrane fusion protein (multidrug efflux system)